MPAHITLCQATEEGHLDARRGMSQMMSGPAGAFTELWPAVGPTL